MEVKTVTAIRESGKTNANTYWLVVGPARVTASRPLVCQPGYRDAGDMFTCGGMNEPREGGAGGGGERVSEAVLEMRSLALITAEPFRS
ncbi:hypothetical protein C1H46_044050 [Malus baccata]|uniref:Uncharacterized protein n=1 Tax=Malus baccata TaxID=106549 RepID=A0A540K855_MALBA|nr:hypothetical protein C1H46_044048 [Malus baccata]TQD70417.1 hypothetical protein C1H46_044050 [Malus baccata]